MCWPPSGRKTQRLYTAVISFYNVVFYFRSLKEEEDFVDVTLSCEESQYTAHKVVLSACSPYFRKLLKVRPQQASRDSRGRDLLLFEY